jgi:O-antigen ligase
MPTTIIQPVGRRRARGKLFRSTNGIGRRLSDSEGQGLSLIRVPALTAGGDAGRQDPYRWPFRFLYLFTLLLYVRPNDLIPAMGTFPLVKIIAIMAPIAYIFAQQQLNKPIINWTTEVKMVFVMLSIGFLLTPISASPADSFNTINDVFIKAVIIFILLIGLLNTRARLQSIISLTVFCGAWLAIFAIKNYASGNFTMSNYRIEGVVGGMFGNPNDLAAALNMLIPLAVTLAIMTSGRIRLLYIACALLMSLGVLVTFSRAGFITFVALAGVLVLKFGRSARAKAGLTAVVFAILLLAGLSDSYKNRLSSIFDSEKDTTGSAQERSELLKHGLDLAIRHPIVGLGMGNFHIYSIKEKVAHNGYVETAAELGAIGLLAYLTLILAPLRGLARIEREVSTNNSRAALQMRYLSIGLQATLVAYIVNSFFLSIQYLWYIYYAAGYAVALRQIYAAERVRQTNFAEANPAEAAPPIRRYPLGKLWKQAPRKPAGSIWPAYRFRKGF